MVFQVPDRKEALRNAVRASTQYKAFEAFKAWWGEDRQKNEPNLVRELRLARGRIDAHLHADVVRHIQPLPDAEYIFVVTLIVTSGREDRFYRDYVSETRSMQYVLSDGTRSIVSQFENLRDQLDVMRELGRFFTFSVLQDTSSIGNIECIKQLPANAGYDDLVCEAMACQFMGGRLCKGSSQLYKKFGTPQLCADMVLVGRLIEASQSEYLDGKKYVKTMRFQNWNDICKPEYEMTRQLTTIANYLNQDTKMLCVYDSSTDVICLYAVCNNNRNTIVPNLRVFLRAGFDIRIEGADVDMFLHHLDRAQSDLSINSRPLEALRKSYDYDYLHGRFKDTHVDTILDGFNEISIEMLSDLQKNTVKMAQYCAQNDMRKRASVAVLKALEPDKVSQAPTSFTMAIIRGTPCITRAVPGELKENERRSIMIGNGTGAGKTLTAMLTHRTRLDSEKRSRSAVMVQDTLWTHWRDEIHKHTVWKVIEGRNGKTPCEVLVVRGKADVQEAARRLRLPYESTGTELYLITHNGFRYMCEHYNQPNGAKLFDRVFFEEAHKLSNDMVNLRIPPSFLMYGSPFVVAITATPEENLNRIAKLMGYHGYYSVMLLYRMHKRDIKKGRIKIEVDEVMCENSPEETAFFTDVAEQVKEGYAEGGDSTGLSQMFRIVEGVTNGGRIHSQLLLNRLRKLVQERKNRKRHRYNYWDQGGRNQKKNSDIFSEKQAKTRAYVAKGDDCPVCSVEGFDDPVQANCGHVYCKACVETMFEMNIRPCPMCAKVMSSFTRPWFSDEQREKTAKSSTSVMDLVTGESSSSKKAPEEKKDPETVYGMLNPLAGDQAGVLTMNGKTNAFRDRFKKWAKDYAPGRRAIMFVQKGLAYQTYLQVIQQEKPDTKLSIAGLGGADRKTSLHDIDRFKRGETDILMLSPAYCTGFDLAEGASEVWILGLTLKICEAVQAIGRVYRYSQTADTVHVRVFLNPGTFGHFMWENRRIGRFALSRSTLLWFLVWHRANHVPMPNPNNMLGMLYTTTLEQSIDSMRYVVERVLGKNLKDCNFITYQSDKVIVDFKLIFTVWSKKRTHGNVSFYNETGRMCTFMNIKNFNNFIASEDLQMDHSITSDKPMSGFDAITHILQNKKSVVMDEMSSVYERMTSNAIV